MTYVRILSMLLVLSGCLLFGQTEPITAIPAEVDFSRRLQEWDGFGFNYVEAAQTRDYAVKPQDLGGFSLLSAEQKAEIIALIFGLEGLDVDILKMFLDPWRQESPGAPFDHETTARHMLEFAEAGAKLRREAGRELIVIVTLYGPPPWATVQKHIGGRDLDWTQGPDLIAYVLDWVEFLRGKGLDVRYISPHNEGEDFYRWTFDEGKQRLERFDYNAYWRPRDVNRFIVETTAEIERRGMKNLSVTNGEPSNWTRFYHWGYATALRHDGQALRDLGLVTTHGFINGDPSKMSYGTAQSLTMDLLREDRPDLKAWVTSLSWGEMDTRFLRLILENISAAKVNAVIPWAGIQLDGEWFGDYKHANAAIRVDREGGHHITQGYSFYKQLTSAGHRGMEVAYSSAANAQVHMLAFAGAESGFPDAFVISDSIAIWGLPIRIAVNGTDAKRFRAFRSSEDGQERFKEIGVFDVDDGAIVYDPPSGTTTTFISEP